MSRIILYYVRPPERDRWVPGDRWIRSLARRLGRGHPRPGGLDRVFLNLQTGLDRLGVHYQVNVPFTTIESDDLVGVLGVGHHCLTGYDRPNPIVAGIGLMTHPSEWPELCDEYPVVTYLQHSKWAADVYRPYFGERCAVWPVGIDTNYWRPNPMVEKQLDVLIYDKIGWDRERRAAELLDPLSAELRERGLSFAKIRYGHYDPKRYRSLLGTSRAMVFLSAHESQGLAYQECLAMNVPVLAWDPGECLDPNRFDWGDPVIPATSVPYWDDHCGERFPSGNELARTLDQFLVGVAEGRYEPRAYILEHLTAEACAANFLEILRASRRPARGSATGTPAR